MTQETLRELFEYKDGNLYWKFKTHKSGVNRIGTIAGCITVEGYRLIKVNRIIWLAHRLIFMYHNGFFPETIDHINKNKSDNRIENLREATYSQNNANRSIHKNNNSGLKGVFKRKDRNLWMAKVNLNGKRVYIKSFRTKEEAYEAYKKAAIIHHKDFSHE